MLHRNKITYVELPEWYQTGRMKEAKATISLNINIPKSLEGKTEKFMKQCLKDFNTAFKDFIDSLD